MISNIGVLNVHPIVCVDALSGVLQFQYRLPRVFLSPSPLPTCPRPSFPPTHVYIHPWWYCESERFPDFRQVQRVHVKDLLQRIRRVCM